jgi:hypothetical protein
MQPNMGPNMGPGIPGDGRPTNVPGIFRREGGSGEPEFYNLTDNKAPDRLTGTGLGRSDQTRGAVQGMQDRQDARMQALLRNEQGMQARPAGGGAVGSVRAPRVGSDDMFNRTDALMERANDLYNRADRARSLTERSRYLKQARAMMGMAEGSQTGATQMSGQQANLDAEAMKQSAALQQAAAAAQAGEEISPRDFATIERELAAAGKSRAETFEIMKRALAPPREQMGLFDVDSDFVNALTTARGREGVASAFNDAEQRARANEAWRVLSSAGPPDELLAAYHAGNLADNPAIVQALRAVGLLNEEGMAEGGLVPGAYEDNVMSYAAGGMVDDPMMDPMLMDMGGDDMGALDMAGMGGDLGMGGMDMGLDPMMEDYEQYAAVAEQMGLPVIPFEQFAQIMEAAQQENAASPEGAMGFARGGAVDASGKMVVDPNPAAATDSIPAMIDGQQPAALDSGEFVIPRHAVMFHGIDKLNKLIAQADQDGTGPR